MLKAELPNFLMITTIGKGKEELDYIDIKTRINPYHITSYCEGFLDNYKGDSTRKVTIMYVSGVQYWVDMSIEDVDEMMRNIDRSLSFNENNL